MFLYTCVQRVPVMCNLILLSALRTQSMALSKALSLFHTRCMTRHFLCCCIHNHRLNRIACSATLAVTAIAVLRAYDCGLNHCHPYRSVVLFAVVHHLCITWWWCNIAQWACV